LKKKGHGIDEHQEYRKEADPEIDDEMGNLKNLCHQENKGEKYHIDKKRGYHFKKNISIYNGIDPHKPSREQCKRSNKRSGNIL